METGTVAANLTARSRKLSRVIHLINLLLKKTFIMTTI